MPSPSAEHPGLFIRDPYKYSDAMKRRSEEHTSELQSHHDLVCRLLLEKKKKKKIKKKKKKNKKKKKKKKNKKINKNNNKNNNKKLIKEYINRKHNRYKETK